MIQRVVRSTLSAEAYSCEDSVGMLIWARSTLAEILYSRMDAAEIVHDTCPVKCISATDCRACMTRSRRRRKVSMTDRRLSLEAAILRQSLEEVSIKWVKSEQMLAACLTKVFPGGYARKIVISNLWNLGPDDRVPSKRERKLV
eukprot:5289590-Pyramimonas_sp.AAC.1